MLPIFDPITNIFTSMFSLLAYVPLPFWYLIIFCVAAGIIRLLVGLL